MKIFKHITAIILVFCILCTISSALAVGNSPISKLDLEVPPISGEFGVEDDFESDDEVLLGDVNHDGKLSNSDLVMLCRYVLDIITEIDFVAADLKKDNRISNADVVTLARLLLTN